MEKKKVIHISHAIDAAAAHHAARELAGRVGFDEKDSEEIAIVVSELASNQFTHAQGGSVTLEALNGEKSGIRVEAVDAGPGIPDIEKALTDGYSTAGGLGLGLGTVNRLMDELAIESQPGQGTRVVGSRWLRPKREVTASPVLDIGVATRPSQGIGVNGDAFVIKPWSGGALVGLIDGLGHGQLAYQAAEAARQYIESHADQPLVALFRGTALACSATRGVVMALARFDLTDPNPALGHFSFASLGNIEVRLLGSQVSPAFVLRRGVVGLHAPDVVVTEHSWSADSILILHSDGISSHWQPENYPSIYTSTASEAAQELLRSLAREDDDATVMVVRTSRKGGQR